MIICLPIVILIVLTIVSITTRYQIIYPHNNAPLMNSFLSLFSRTLFSVVTSTTRGWIEFIMWLFDNYSDDDVIVIAM